MGGGVFKQAFESFSDSLLHTASPAGNMSLALWVVVRRLDHWTVVTHIEPVVCQWCGRFSPAEEQKGYVQSRSWNTPGGGVWWVGLEKSTALLPGLEEWWRAGRQVNDSGGIRVDWVGRDLKGYPALPSLPWTGTAPTVCFFLGCQARECISGCERCRSVLILFGPLRRCWNTGGRWSNSHTRHKLLKRIGPALGHPTAVSEPWGRWVLLIHNKSSPSTEASSIPIVYQLFLRYAGTCPSHCSQPQLINARPILTGYLEAQGGRCWVLSSGVWLQRFLSSVTKEICTS